MTINIVNTDGWSSHSHGGDSTLHKLSIFHLRVYSQNSVRVHLIYTSPAQKLNSHKAQICIYIFVYQDRLSCIIPIDIGSASPGNLRRKFQHLIIAAARVNVII